jgi:uncharacterized membrane protein YqjE
MSAVPNEKSLGQLFSDLAAETRTLVRQEVALAKTELKENAARVGKHAGMAAAGGLVVLMGALPIIAALVIALGHQIGYATSAFIVGVLFVIAGAVITMKALSALKSDPMKPEETAEQIKETKQWAKQQVR